jgi:hydrogenase maturation protease
VKARHLIVGLGSAHGDDQFGWRVAETLAAACDSADFEVRQARTPAELLDWLEGVERLIVCDACQNLGTAGRLHRWQWPADELSRVRSATSHNLGLTAALELAETLDFLPGDVLILAAEGRNFGPTAPMSSEVETAVSQAVEELRGELTRC